MILPHRLKFGASKVLLCYSFGHQKHPRQINEISTVGPIQLFSLVKCYLISIWVDSHIDLIVQ